MNERREREQSSSVADNSGAEIIGKLIGVIIVVVAIVWFVFSVAIPLLAINIAVIALTLAAIRKEVSRFLLPLSVVGAAFVLTDYNNGWFTKTLATNVSFFADLIPVFLYINVFAGLFAAYFLIRNFLNKNAPREDSAGEFTKRNVVVMGCLLLVGGLTVGLQTVVDSQRKRVRESAVAHPVLGPQPGRATGEAESERTSSNPTAAATSPPTIPALRDTQSSMIDNRFIVGTYLGTIGKKEFKLFIENVEGDNVDGYNVTGINKRPVKGRIVNKSTKPTGSGGSWTIVKLILTEPGDDKWDGEFNIDRKSVV